MLTLGAHLSASKGFVSMLDTAMSIGANTFQFFTRNPRGGKAKDVDLKDIENYKAKAEQCGFKIVIAHAPYTLNTFKDDISRMELLGNQLYNFHPGSHVGQGEEVGIQMIADTLNNVLFENMTTTVLLETMAGKGSEIGKTFEELAQIIDRVELNEKLGVCLDTCHVYDGGYDIVNNLDNVLDEFDKVIGLDRLKALHLNDSKNPFASHKDRHEKIGEGTIGVETFEKIVNHPVLSQLPMFLETPNELDGYKKEIELLRSLEK
jgi:deoxyribonuclease-4